MKRRAAVQIWISVFLGFCKLYFSDSKSAFLRYCRMLFSDSVSGANFFYSPNVKSDRISMGGCEETSSCIALRLPDLDFWISVKCISQILQDVFLRYCQQEQFFPSAKDLDLWMKKVYLCFCKLYISDSKSAFLGCISQCCQLFVFATVKV